MNNNKQEPKFLNGDRELYDKYTIRRDRVIGRGNSFVYEVVDDEGNLQCIKQIAFDESMSGFIFRKEVELLNKLKCNPHPNIVEYRGSYCLQERTHMKKQRGYIQMEKGITNLKEYLEHRRERRAFFSEDDILSFITSMLDVFVHLQKIQVAHRDIKPSNILIFSEDPLFFKVCDVGAGTAVEARDMTENRTVIGTPYYLSPQLFNAHRHQHRLTNYKAYKSDSYSLGLVFLEFCTLQRFEDRQINENQRIAMAIGKVKKIYPNIVGIGKVLRAMLDENVKTRMDFQELQAYVSDNDLLRSKIKKIPLDPQLVSKLTSSQEITIQSFDDLNILTKIAGSGKTAPILRIDITTSNGQMKKTEREMLQEIKNIRHISVEELSLKMEMCGLTEKQVDILAAGISKNPNQRILSLELWNNEIRNEGLERIMSAIQTNLTTTQELSISFAKNGLKIGSEFEELFNFSEAERLQFLHLNLGHNQITSDSFPILIRNVGQASTLERLELFVEKAKMSHISFAKGIKELQKLRKLQYLSIKISDNTTRDEGMFGLSDLFPSLENLREFYLLVRNSEVGDKGLTEFFKSLPAAEKLQKVKLNLIGNTLTQKILKVTPQNLANLKNLSSIDLNLSNNKISDQGLKNLTVFLGAISSIRKLRLILDNCELTEKGCLYIGRLISQLPTLTDLELSLRYNEIKLKGIQCICQGLLTTKKVKKLKLILEATKIGDYAANYLASCLLKIRGLSAVDLNMENCELGQLTMENIAKLVKQCSKKADEITVSMRRNREVRLQLYEQIKKQLNSSRIAVRIDNPSTLEYSQTSA